MLLKCFMIRFNRSKHIFKAYGINVVNIRRIVLELGARIVVTIQTFAKSIVRLCINIDNVPRSEEHTSELQSQR